MKMSNHFLGRKWHIKPRIFIMLLFLLALVFTSVFVSFNLFINNYILSNVQTQLDGLVKNFGMYDDKPPDKPPGDFYMPDLSGQQKNRIGAWGEVIILGSNYEIKGYDERGGNEGIDELKQIVSSLKNQGINLSSARYVFVDTDEGAYYISSIEDGKRPGSFFVFYVSVAGINHLVDTVNLAMAVIVAAAMLICFLITNVIAGSITKPVKELSDFAEEMGRSNFKRRLFAFQDIEFDELGEAMNRSAEKLDAYDKDQRAFFQNVSHELRTPLQSIRCYAEGVEYGLMDPKKSGATIVSETDRLSELVEDLLYISRVDSITSHVEMQESDLRDTLSLCAENLRPMAEKKGLRFEYQFENTCTAPFPTCWQTLCAILGQPLRCAAIAGLGKSGCRSSTTAPAYRRKTCPIFSNASTRAGTASTASVFPLLSRWWNCMAARSRWIAARGRALPSFSRKNRITWDTSP